MATYIVLNGVFLMSVTLLLYITKVLKIHENIILVGAILLVLTAVFDSLIIGADIVAYDQSKILGVFIFKAPVEDFFYTLLAIIVVPSVWHFMRDKRDATKN